MEPRDHSRLLVVDKKTGEIEHKHFYDLVNYLKPGDVLVFNDTRVIPARLHGTKDTGAHVEVFLLTRRDATDWEVLVRPGKKLQVGAKINSVSYTHLHGADLVLQFQQQTLCRLFADTGQLSEHLDITALHRQIKGIRLDC